MPSTTRRWLVFAVIVGAGITLGICVDFVVRYPGLTFSMVLIAYVLTRPHPPMTYTCGELDRLHNAAAYTLSQLIVPVALAGSTVFLTWQYWVALGPAHALGLALLVVYVADRQTAFMIRTAVAASRRHSARRARVGDEPAPDGDVVDAEVVR